GRGDEDRHGDPDEHRHSPEPGGRRLVHVPFTDAGVELELQAQPPDRPRQREGDRRREDDREQVLLHSSSTVLPPSVALCASTAAGCSTGSSRSPSTSSSCSRVIAPSRRTRTSATSSAPVPTSEVASTMVEGTPFSL